MVGKVHQFMAATWNVRLLLMLESTAKVADLSFIVYFCMPKMRPSSGLIKGIEVLIAGGSFESCVKRRSAERKTYAAAIELRTRKSMEVMVRAGIDVSTWSI